MGRPNARQFLSRVLGYERLRSAQVLVRDRRNIIRARRRAWNGDAGERRGCAPPGGEYRATVDAEKRAKDALKRLKKANATVEELQPKWAAAQQERESMHALTAEVRLRESEEAAFLKTRSVSRKSSPRSPRPGRKSADQGELSVHKDLESQFAPDAGAGTTRGEAPGAEGAAQPDRG